jgi:chemotaxis protein MotB
MKLTRCIAAIAATFFLFGCVTAKEYNARLADISALKSDAASLQERLNRLEAEKAAVQAELAGLHKDFDGLMKRSEALSDGNKKLTADNTNLDNLLKAKKDELSAKIAELRGKLAEKEAEAAAKAADSDALRMQLAALSQEKQAALLEKEKSIAEMKKTYDSLMGEMNEEIKKGEVTITQLKDKLSVNLVEKILFDSGSAEIKLDGKKILDRVAEILSRMNDKQVRVAGHTDNVPIGYRIKERFPSNWELSASRATTVARYLQDKGLDPSLLSASGYSEYRPVAPNDTDEGRAKNRRIEIDLAPKELGKTAAQANTPK